MNRQLPSWRRACRTLTVIAALLLTAASASAQQFLDKGKPSKFIETNVHLFVGGSAQTQNYMSRFTPIREINTTMGAAWGAGVTGEVNLRNFLALGTQLNVFQGNNRLDIAVSNDIATNMSNVFLRNRYYYINIPVYMSFRFNVTHGLRWNVDGGLYYSYGFAGSQKQSAYSSMVNDLGQLVNRVIITKPSFFDDNGTFINKFRRSDIGLHLATSLLFAHRVSIGVVSSFGFKNISYTSGIVNPNIHNITLMATLGYHF